MELNLPNQGSKFELTATCSCNMRCCYCSRALEGHEMHDSIDALDDVGDSLVLHSADTKCEAHWKGTKCMIALTPWMM